LYLLRFEVENIKALIKATNANLSSEQKLAKVYFSAEDFLKNRTMIEEASKASSIKQISDTLKKTDYALALSMGLQSYEENASTTCLDVLLDKVFYEKLFDAYEQLPKKEKHHASFYASLQNDSYTLLTLLRGKNLTYDANWLRLAVPHDNFNLPRETVEALVTAVDFETAIKIAIEGYYGKYFVKGKDPKETLGNAEKAFSKALFDHAKASVITENFNIGAPLAFLTQKEAEVHNLIVLSAGVEAAMKPEEIQSQLLL